jgi:precorrin-2 dehydrogenase/sirohydrochlorin ferrochelatase
MNAENKIGDTNKNGKGNELFPVFFRMDKLKVLVVGGGLVGIVDWANQFSGLTLSYKAYAADDLAHTDLVIAATCIRPLNAQVQMDAKQQGVLINVADTPELCDFYLGSIVQKGDLKIAISTNGQSPTFAKRMRELLEEALPDSIDSILQQLNDIRNKLKGDFEYKVKKMDEITKAMNEEQK